MSRHNREALFGINKMEIHNFKVGDTVKVFRWSPYSGTLKLDGLATIRGLCCREDTYRVAFEDSPKLVVKRYVDPNQAQEAQ